MVNFTVIRLLLPFTGPQNHDLIVCVLGGLKINLNTPLIQLPAGTVHILLLWK